MRRSLLALPLLGLVASALLGCAHAVPPVPALPWTEAPHGDDRPPTEVAGELRDSVTRIVEGGGNLGRLDAVKARTGALGLAKHAHDEWIDWFSFQRNVVVEIPGESDELIIVVAHYDKTDINPLVVPSLLVNGALDELVSWSFLSEGAVDNATGVAVALSLARAVAERPLRRTLRVVLVGAEESGLRGSRAHAARLSDDEWDRLAFVVNLDGVAIEGRENCVTENVSAPYLSLRARRAAARIGLPLGRGEMPIVGMSDYASFAETGFFVDVGRSFLFNVTGALLPQRSYFAMPHRASVLSYMACDPIDLGDVASSLVLLPLGSFHGPRDHRGRVDPRKLYEMYAVLLALLREMDGEGLEGAPSP